MKIYRSNDTVTIEGYVNAVERNSKPLYQRGMYFVERIAAGAFARALKRAGKVKVLLNHDWSRELGDTTSNLELEEDSIGLKARFTTSDPEIVREAENGDFVGWSFGYKEIPEAVEQFYDSESKLPLRKVNDLNLLEVSILNRKKTPAYAGTLVNVRDDGIEEKEEVFFGQESDDAVDVKIEVREYESEPKAKVVKEAAPEVEEVRAEEPEAEQPKEETPEVKEVSSEYYAGYRNMIAEMRKSNR